MRELRKSRSSRTYELREGGRVHLRHDGVDAFLIEELFENDVYAMPEGARAALAGATHEPRIVDLGANIGLATHRLLRLFPNGRVVAYEPDPSTAAVLRRFVAENDLDDRVEVIEAFAGPRAGTVTFRALGSPLSRAVGTAAIETGAGLIEVPQRDVFADLERADLIKIDIEGAEWPILRDPRWPGLPARAVVLEVHPDQSLTESPVRTATAVLEAAGYTTKLCDLQPPADGGESTGVLWAWRDAERAKPTT